MRWKPTIILLALAGALFAFIYFVDRGLPGTDSKAKPAPPLLDFRAGDVNSIHLRRTNRFLVKVERGAQGWNITSPITYPAESFAIDHLVQDLAGLEGQSLITVHELNAQKRSIAEFGLDAPAATLVLAAGERRIELMFGSKNTVGDRVYVQLYNSPDIYTVSSAIFDRLPMAADNWRDISLINMAGINHDRLEVRAPARTFAIQMNQTNHQIYVSKPTPARADRAKIEALLRKIETEPVRQFVSDDPHTDLEPLGLQPPEAEIAFGLGPKDLVVVQLGKAATNDLIYARRLANTNIVLVSKSLLEAVQIAPSELRDRRLLAFDPDLIDTIEVLGEDKFTVLRQGSNTWRAIKDLPVPADADLVRDWLNLLGTLEANVEKDVVTDFGNYGLAPPWRQVLLKSSYTNAAGQPTNRVIAQMSLSGKQGDKIFARSFEDSVYWIKPSDYDRLPFAAWQLRDRRVWAFATNQVAKITLRDNGYTREMVRSTSGDWVLAKGSSGMINPFEIEEVVFQLSELRAAVWVEQTDANRLLYGFKNDGYKLALEIKSGDKTQNYVLELGEKAPSQFPYAIASMDGQGTIFEFPVPLVFKLKHALSNPPLRAAVQPPQ